MRFYIRWCRGEEKWGHRLEFSVDIGENITLCFQPFRWELNSWEGGRSIGPFSYLEDLRTGRKE